MKVADFTVDELQALIRKVVHEELQDIIADLGSSDRIPFEEVKSRLNLA